MIMSDQYAEYQIRYGNKTITMAVSDPDDLIQKRHVHGRFYEIEELEYIRTLLPPNSTVADVGANVGNHSLFFSQVCRAACVIAFEVNEEAIALLRRNVAINRDEAIDLSNVGCAVGNGSGFVKVKSKGSLHNLGSATFVACPDVSGYRTEALDKLLDSRDVDFIKIDVEGMEFDVLEGALETIRRSRPILFVEVRKNDLDRYFSLMKSMNYRTERTFQRYRGIFTFSALYGR